MAEFCEQWSPFNGEVEVDESSQNSKEYPN